MGAGADGQTSDALAGLHDIVLPVPVSMWPATPAAWTLAAVFAFAVAWLIAIGIRRYRSNGYRRDALKGLALIEARFASQPELAVRALPALVKRTALYVFPRQEVAALSGSDWLRFLDSHYADGPFVSGAGALLPEIAYRSRRLSSDEFARLIQVLRRWIRTHRV
jgi:hypothetical protein